jgi:N-acetylglucosamine malate deacetylase 1
MNILAFGAHPDDCELQMGGVATMWADRGHSVKLVSTTNGDIGHWRDAGGPLASRRKAEVEHASRILGTTAEVLDNHDGELEPTLENRRTIIRIIRQWNADLVLSPRPNDYHPDHRYTGILVQDAAFMVTVPFICPDVTPLSQNPVFMYYVDRFQRPYPSMPDIAISIDGVIERKLDALAVLESQFLEGGAIGNASLLPKNAEHRERRVAEVRTAHANRNVAVAHRFRDLLKEYYGEKEGSEVRYAEAFEICEYGRHPDKEELMQLFPFFAD